MQSQWSKVRKSGYTDWPLHLLTTGGILSINELADKVKTAGVSFGLRVEIEHVNNPRIEAEEHYYNPSHTGLMELGLKPHYLDAKTLAEMLQFVMQYRDRIDRDQIYRQVKWAWYS